MRDARTYLLIIGEREALAWVLRESTMAFPATRRAEVDRLAPGDELFTFTTRGCWHNPTRDRGRVIGRAHVTSPVVAYDEAVEIAGREFTRGCGIEILSLAPVRDGVELGPLVPRLDAFPDGNGWGDTAAPATARAAGCRCHPAPRPARASRVSPERRAAGLPRPRRRSHGLIRSDPPGGN